MGRIALATALVAGLLAVPASARAGLEVFRGLNAPGLTAKGNVALGVPPDTTAAIGPRHLVETVNLQVGVFARRDLRPLARLDSHRFWGLPAGVQLVDPQVAWDAGSRRWYQVLLANDNVSVRRSILLAWSKTADPSDLARGWCRTSIPTGRLLDDYPKLGFSRRHVLIGTNVADLEERRVLFSRVWAVAKPPSGSTACGRPPMTALPRRGALREAGGRKAGTPVPAGALDRGYVVSAECVGDGEEGGEEGFCPAAGRRLTIWRVTGPGAAPRIRRLGPIAVRRFRPPALVRQRGTNRRLDASDARLTQAVAGADPAHPGRALIWTQHTVAWRRGLAQVRWYALDPARLRVARQGSVRVPGASAFNGAIAPTGNGRAAVIDYNAGGRRLLPQIRARVAGRPRSEIELARSAAPDRSCDAGDACQWGDYAFAGTDPVRPRVVWGANQTIGPPGQGDAFGITWRTRVFALRPGR
jgi:hypothetical protein